MFAKTEMILAGVIGLIAGLAGGSIAGATVQYKHDSKGNREIEAELRSIVDSLNREAENETKTKEN